ncbi:hypothetical protein J6590_033663, partial [Homalodisca vitripennis]
APRSLMDNSTPCLHNKGKEDPETLSAYKPLCEFDMGGKDMVETEGVWICDKQINGFISRIKILKFGRHLDISYKCDVLSLGNSVFSGNICGRWGLVVLTAGHVLGISVVETCTGVTRVGVSDAVVLALSAADVLRACRRASVVVSTPETS